MQIKTIVRDHLTPDRMAVIRKTRNKCWQGCGKKGTLCTVGGSVDWCDYYGK